MSEYVTADPVKQRQLIKPTTIPLALLEISRLIGQRGITVKNIVKVLVVALTSLAFNGPSFAQAKPVTPATPPAAPATEKETEMKVERAQATVLTGKVTAVDAKAGRLTVKTKDKEVNLTTDSKTTKAALEKLKVGDTAKVFERGGTVIAASPVKAESKTKTAN